MHDISLSNINENELVLFFLNKCGIKNNNISDLNNLNGIVIYRDTLLDDNLYKEIKKYIPYLKKLLKSSIYTSTQKNADLNQQWPLINLIRQLLRNYNYLLVPKRESDGYTKDGKKKYKRLFEIVINKNNDYQEIQEIQI